MGWFQNLLAKIRGTSPPPPPQDSDAFESLVWLEPHENPFGVRVLDCRPLAQTLLSTTRDANCIRFFGSPESQTGEQFRGQTPQSAVQVKCELTYPLTVTLPEGPVFLAGAMEEKWNLYHFAGVLYFARSWNGHLYYTAAIVQSATELRVIEVAAARSLSDDESLVVRQVDFLIRSHLLGQIAPHPVPPLPTKEQIAIWSFQHYGCRGLFAAVCQAEA